MSLKNLKIALLKKQIIITCQIFPPKYQLCVSYFPRIINVVSAISLGKQALRQSFPLTKMETSVISPLVRQSLPLRITGLRRLFPLKFTLPSANSPRRIQYKDMHCKTLCYVYFLKNELTLAFGINFIDLIFAHRENFLRISQATSCHINLVERRLKSI